MSYYPPRQHPHEGFYPNEQQHSNQYSAYSPAPQAGSAPSQQHPNSETGPFEGGSYRISHRSTNTILTVHLQNGASIKSKPGAMVEMSSTVTLQGKIKFSMKKLFTGSEMAESVYTGPGEICLAPTLFGDIVTVHVNNDDVWNIGKDAFLACTPGVHKEAKSQGLGKAFFSGEDLFVYRVSGNGILWLSSFGAITRRDLRPNEEHIVDNGHLVAWNCNYKIERAGSGALSSIKTGEGLVCRFTGPGTIYIQTRNLDDFAAWVAAQAPSSSS